MILLRGCAGEQCCSSCGSFSPCHFRHYSCSIWAPGNKVRITRFNEIKLHLKSAGAF